MKYRKQRTIITDHVVVDLEPEDHILVKMENNTFFALSYSIAKRAIQFVLTSPGDILEKEPFLEISQRQMEDLDSKKKGEYMSVTFPSSLYDEVKSRLKGLPIIV